MAKTLSSASIIDGSTVEAWHVTQSIDAFNGVEAYDITISGSLTLLGNTVLTGTASYASTASYAANAGGADTGSLLTTASVSSNTITFTKGDTSTFNITVDTGSGGGSTDTGSLLTTASVSDDTITFTKGDASTFNIVVNNVVAADTASYIAGADVDGTVTIAGSLKANGNLLGLTTASGHIIPAANDTYDLGNAEKKFRDLYLGSNSIYMSGSSGWMTGSWDGTNFRVNNNALVRSAVTSSMTVANSTTSTNVSGIYQDINNIGSPVSAPLKLIAGGDTLSGGTVTITAFNGELQPKTMNRDCFITATYVDSPGQPLQVTLNSGDIVITEAGATSNSQVSFIVLYT